MDRFRNLMFYLLGFVTALGLLMSYPYLLIQEERIAGPIIIQGAGDDVMEDSVEEEIAEQSPLSGRALSLDEDSRTVPIVAVNSEEDRGEIGNLTLRMIPGHSDILIDATPFTEPDLQYSAYSAIEVAKAFTHKQIDDRDMVLSLNVESVLVGGGSAGAATAIAAIALIDGRQIRDDVIMTGTINMDGTIGEVGGVLAKARAAADAGYKILLVPDGQSAYTTYRRVVDGSTGERGRRWYDVSYVPTTVDIGNMSREWGLEIVEVSDIDEAVQHMLI